MKKKGLYAECFAEFGKKIIFVAVDNNLIYTVDKITGDIDVIGMIPEEAFSTRRLIGSINLWNDKIIYTPFNAKNIWISDLNCKNWEKINLPSGINPECKLKFIGAVIYDDKLIMFGHFYYGIVVFDLHKQKFECIPINIDNGGIGLFYAINKYIEGNNVYLAVFGTNKVVIFDMDTYAYKIRTVGDKNKQFCAITYYKNYFWIAPKSRSGSVLRWNGKEEVMEYQLPDNNEKIVLDGIYGFGNEILLYSPLEKTIGLNIFNQEEYLYHSETNVNCVDILEDNSLLIISENEIKIISKEKITSFDTDINNINYKLDDFTKKIKNSIIYENAPLNESVLFDLQLFMNVLLD